MATNTVVCARRWFGKRIWSCGVYHIKRAAPSTRAFIEMAFDRAMICSQLECHERNTQRDGGWQNGIRWNSIQWYGIRQHDTWMVTWTRWLRCCSTETSFTKGHLMTCLQKDGIWENAFRYHSIWSKAFCRMEFYNHTQMISLQFSGNNRLLTDWWVLASFLPDVISYPLIWLLWTDFFELLALIWSDLSEVRTLKWLVNVRLFSARFYLPPKVPKFGCEKARVCADLDPPSAGKGHCWKDDV